MNLYQIDKQIEGIIESADPVTGELPMEALTQLQMAKEEKQINVIKYIKHLDNNSNLIDLEIERLEDMQDKEEKRKAWLENYLRTSMEIDGATEITFGLHKAKIVGTVPDLIITDPIEFEKNYSKTVTTVKLLRAQARKDLAAGKHVPCARLEPKKKLKIV